MRTNRPGRNQVASTPSKSLAGLAAGDGVLAGQGYERLVTRWRRVASFEQAM